jgi:hypothetical protein
MNTQKGFAHTYLIFGLIIFISFALTAVFLRSFIERQSASTSADEMAIGSPTKPNQSPAEIKYKTYTSLSGSGLTFDYPDSWHFEPPAGPPVSRGDRKTVMLSLYSQSPSVVNGRPEIASDNMCISFLELQGAHPFRYIALTNTNHIADLVVGQSEVSLVENEPNLASGVNSAMQLLNENPASEHGASYVELKDNYYLLATASRNCFAADRLKKKDITTEIEQARAILKSVRITD